jgi:hypothetical protein
MLCLVKPFFEGVRSCFAPESVRPMRTIAVVRNARVPFSASIDLVDGFFREHAPLIVGPSRWLRAAVVPEAAQIRDTTDTTMIHEALAIVWKARMALPLPDFHGLLTVRVNAPTTEIRIEGSYDSPLGIAGRAFDGLLGRHIATSTLNVLLGDICDYVEAGWSVMRLQYSKNTGAGLAS